MTRKTLPLHLFAGLQMLAGPAIAAAPFVFGFGNATAFFCVLVGTLLIGLALQLPGPTRSIPLSAHASYDYALALFAAFAGLAVGVLTGAWAQGLFLVGISAVLVALTASTRFSAPRGA